ncbi:MAG TPA: SRPBCC domain-containing protein [Acidimicrobiales bacterium]|nr:SRPBCC domain-containing protein [Acidimicrobiales bacterium]
MADLTITREIVIEAPVEVVWRTITEPDQIALWFADRVDVDIRPGAAGTLVFEDKATAEAVSAAVVVDAVEPPHRFSFRWGAPEGETPVPGNSALAEFTLIAEAGDRTRLRVSETGLDGLPWPDEEKARYAEDHRDGWRIHFGRLGALLGSPAG